MLGSPCSPCCGASACPSCPFPSQMLMRAFTATFGFNVDGYRSPIPFTDRVTVVQTSGSSGVAEYLYSYENPKFSDGGFGGISRCIYTSGETIFESCFVSMKLVSYRAANESGQWSQAPADWCVTCEASYGKTVSVYENEGTSSQRCTFIQYGSSGLVQGADLLDYTGWFRNIFTRQSLFNCFTGASLLTRSSWGFQTDPYTLRRSSITIESVS
jgi:hypothetical protein